MSELFLPPVEQLINVDLFNQLQESDVGQFGPDYTNLERYKQAGEYALEAMMYAQMAEDYSKEIYNKIKTILEGAGDAGTLATLSLDTGASKIGTFEGITVQEKFQQYESPVGFSKIGKVKSFEQLRDIEPDTPNEWVMVETVVVGGAVVNAIFHYDASDTTSIDDDYRIIVTNNGNKRWVYDCANGIDIRLGGLLADGSNFGTAANKIIKGEISKIIASNSTFLRIVQTIFVPHPTYLSKNSYYTIDTPIHIPSFMGFLGTGWIDLRTSLTTAAIVVNNMFPGLTGTMGGYINSQGFSTFKNNLGKFRLFGPGVTTSTEAGIQVGNTAVGDNINVRDLYIRDIQVRNFQYGIGFYGYDTYIITIEDCDFLQNNHNIGGLGIDKQNSGERILFRSCTIGNSRLHNIYWNLVGWNMTFDNCSLDYCGGSTLVFGNGGRGCVVRFTNGTFIEGFKSNLVSQEPISNSWVFDGGRKNRVIFDTAFINAQGVAGDFSSRRQIVAASADMLMIDFINTDIRWPKEESQPHVALFGYNDATAGYVSSRFVNTNTPYDQSLTKYGMSMNAGLYRFTTGVSGAAVGKDVATNLTFTTTGAGTATYGGIDTEDNLEYITLTSASPTDSFEIRNLELATPVTRFTDVYSAISIKMNGVTSGNVKASTRIYYSGTPTYTTTSSGTAPDLTYTTTRALSSKGNAIGTEKDVTALLSVQDTTLTTNKYVGVQTFCEVTNQVNNSLLLASPAIRITGFVGSIQVKLPAFWIPETTSINVMSL